MTVSFAGKYSAQGEICKRCIVELFAFCSRGTSPSFLTLSRKEHVVTIIAEIDLFD